MNVGEGLCSLSLPNEEPVYLYLFPLAKNLGVAQDHQIRCVFLLVYTLIGVYKALAFSQSSEISKIL